MEGRAKAIRIFAVTKRAAAISESLSIALGGEVVPPERLKDGGLVKETRAAFRSAGALIFICAAGIAVRAIAPFVRSKDSDPAVVVIDERGAFAISLLSGHLGGANALAHEAASITGALPVVTTATDLWSRPCIEDVAKAFSLRIDDKRGIKSVNSALLDGSEVVIADTDARRRAAIRGAFGGAFRYARSVPRGAGAVAVVTSGLDAPPGALVLRPAEIMAGIGCKRGVAKKEIKAALEAAFMKAGLSVKSLAGIATIELKLDEPGLKALARELGVGLQGFEADRLDRVKGVARSGFVKGVTGSGSVAEAAALAATGAKRLLLRKEKIGWVTIALARAPFSS